MQRGQEPRVQGVGHRQDGGQRKGSLSLPTIEPEWEKQQQVFWKHREGNSFFLGGE